MIIIDTPALIVWAVFVVLSWVAVYKIAVAIERIMQERHERDNTPPAQPRDELGRFARKPSKADTVNAELRAYVAAKQAARQEMGA